MADKSPKDQESSKDAGASPAEKKLPVHKQTAKTMQDGVELTWDLHREGELKPEGSCRLLRELGGGAAEV